jgi:alkaline phosphatase
MSIRIKSWSGRATTALLLGLLLVLILVNPAPAQEKETPILILPVNGAEFLPGVLFDFRVEVHTDTLPEDFAVTINDQAAEEFFGAAPAEENWEFGPEGETPTPAQSVIWRKATFAEPGEYTVQVTADGATQTATWTVREPQAGEAKNVILFIADGGSSALYTAARLVSRGMTNGYYNGSLAFDNFEEVGLLHTSGIDSIITDSANSASAYNTGHKTAVNATGSYPDTSPDKLDDPRIETFAELVARLRQMSIGVVTTSDFTDATPAAVWAHGRDRSSGNRAAYAASVLDEGLMPQVIMGGGGRYMIPQSAEGSRRADERDLFAEYEEAGYTVVTSATELENAMGTPPERLLGIFHTSDMNVWLDRNVYTDNLGNFPDQPGLAAMTTAALEILATNPNGFYLEVEAASLDKQLHPMDFDRALADTIEFDRAIAAAYEWVQANAPDTLIVVTSDHGHSYDVYGTVDVKTFNAATDEAGRRNAIQVYADAGFPTYVDQNGDYFPDSWNVDTALAQGKVDNPNFTEDFQVSKTPRAPSIVLDDETVVDNPDDDPNGLALGGNLPLDADTSVHTMQDVPVYAQGPGSECLGRVIENAEVFFCMAAAIGLDPSAPDGLMAAASKP